MMFARRFSRILLTGALITPLLTPSRAASAAPAIDAQTKAERKAERKAASTSSGQARADRPVPPGPAAQRPVVALERMREQILAISARGKQVKAGDQNAYDGHRTYVRTAPPICQIRLAGRRVADLDQIQPHAGSVRIARVVSVAGDHQDQRPPVLNRACRDLGDGR